MSHHSSPLTNGEGAPERTTDLNTLETTLLRIASAAEDAARMLEDERIATQPTRNQFATLACRIYDARRTRDKFFDRTLFTDPAWDMMLALYCLPARGKILTVSGLCYASGAAPTTALRWVGNLIEAGLVERGPDAIDHRKHLVRLTSEGCATLERYLARIFKLCPPSLTDPEGVGGQCC